MKTLTAGMWSAVALLTACSGTSEVSKCPTPQLKVSSLTVPVDRRWAGSETLVSAAGDGNAFRWTMVVTGLPNGVGATGAGAAVVSGTNEGLLALRPTSGEGRTLEAAAGTYTLSVRTAPIEGEARCDPEGVPSVTITLVLEDRAVECATDTDCRLLDFALRETGTETLEQCTASTDCPQPGNSLTPTYCVAPGAGARLCLTAAVGCTAPLVQVMRTAVEGNTFIDCELPPPPSTCNTRGHCVCAESVSSSGSCY